MYPKSRVSRLRRSRRSKVPLLRRAYRSPIHRRNLRQKLRVARARKRWRKWKKPRPLIYRLRRRPYRYKTRPKRVVIIRDPAPPPPIIIQRSRRDFTESARDALERHNLSLHYADTPKRIIRFIERYHHVSGFQHVVRTHLKSTYGKRQVRALLRLLGDLSSRDSRFIRRIVFRRSTTLDENDNPVPIAILHYRNRRYRVLPSGLIRVRNR